MARKLPEAEIFIQIRPQLFELACAYTHTHTAAKTKLSPLSTVRMNQQAMREAATICPHPCELTFDILALKVVSESRVTWATSVPILVFLGLFVLDLGPMYATDRQTSDTHHRLMPP